MRNYEIFTSAPQISIKAGRKKNVISPTISKVKNKNKLLQVIVFQLFNYCECQNKKKILYL